MAPIIAPDAKVIQLGTGMKFTEGPVWLPAKNMVVFSDTPNGNKLGLIPTPEDPANVCFGGKYFDTLFITAKKSLDSVKTMAKGALPPKR